MDSRLLLRTYEEFAQAYDRNIKRVYQISYLYLKNHHDAQDAAQSVFEKFLHSNKVFNSENHEKAWFITVTKNHCTDQLRKFWKSRRIDIETIEVSASCGNENDMDLIKALLSLPSKYKNIIYLYYIEGYTIKEISKMLNRNESTLRNHLSTGRRLLKIDLGGYYEE